MSDSTETWEFHNFLTCFCSRWLNLVTVLNYKNFDFHPTLTLTLVDLFDQFGICTDENLGVAWVGEDVVEQVVD